jgi:NAD-reducing hydrogenase large subunit
MKFPFIQSLGAERRLVQGRPAGAAAELRLHPTPLAEAARQELGRRAGRQIVHAPLAYHWARMIELLHSAEVIAELLRPRAVGGTT